MANYRFDDNGNEIMPEVKSVAWVNDYISGLLGEEMILQDIYVSGEISNFKHHSSGHMYFSLKDEKGEIRAVIFRSYASKLLFEPKNGMKVIVHARVNAWNGICQLYVDSMQQDGIGSLYLQYERLKKRLFDEGLFDESHKRQLPKFPKTIGIVTSDTGAAVRDIIHVATRRYPIAKLVLFPSLVQGEDAPGELIKGVEYFNLTDSADVIIIGRGGGSIEDLWAFNDEELARTIYNSHIPIISAVGHEVDYTICDFVADVRAATPSAAAEVATPDISELKRDIVSYSRSICSDINDVILQNRALLDSLSKSRALTMPGEFTRALKERISANAKNINLFFKATLDRHRGDFNALCGRLGALNPLAVLSRGYGAVFDGEGKVVKSVEGLNVGEKIKVRLSDGSFDADIVSVERGEKSDG
ncbi:MAG: exodeoxyribonuclease VII large subunit [Eubacteriales bacterium]